MAIDQKWLMWVRLPVLGMFDSGLEASKGGGVAMARPREVIDAA